MSISEAYSLLELPAGSSIEEIKKAYRKLALKFHPDKNKAKGADDKFKQINEAHKLLIDLSDASRTRIIPPISPRKPVVVKTKKVDYNAPHGSNDLFGAFDMGIGPEKI